MRTTRPIRQTLAPTDPIDPLRRRLPRTTDHDRSRTDRRAGSDQLTQPTALTYRQRRTSMKIHPSPPWDRDSSNKPHPRRAQRRITPSTTCLGNTPRSSLRRLLVGRGQANVDPWALVWSGADAQFVLATT